MRDIVKDEELTWDYQDAGGESWFYGREDEKGAGELSAGRLSCKCGSPRCVGRCSDRRPVAAICRLSCGFALVLSPCVVCVHQLPRLDSFRSRAVDSSGIIDCNGLQVKSRTMEAALTLFLQWRGVAAMLRHTRDPRKSSDGCETRRGPKGSPHAAGRANVNLHDRSHHQITLIVHWSCNC